MFRMASQQTENVLRTSDKVLSKLLTSFLIKFSKLAHKHCLNIIHKRD